jgi:hypothetical protein
MLKILNIPQYWLVYQRHKFDQMAFPINKPNKSRVSETLVGATLKLIIIIIIYIHPWAKTNAKKEGGRVFRFLIGQGKNQHNLLFYFVILKSTKFESSTCLQIAREMVKREC